MQKKKEASDTVKTTISLPSLFPWNFKIKCYILIVLGLLFYGNTILNKYALDDSIAVERNDYVKQGISGIGKILTTDSYDSYYRQMGGDAKAQYSGGRYRPLSIVFFAIEQTFFGESPLIKHLVNILVYIACVLLIFYFLNEHLLKKLPAGSDIAFLATILFTIHPIHTEVVANIKSLDELMSLTLIIATFIFALRYQADKKKNNLFIALGCFLLSLLAKEYAITLVVLLPLLFYLVGDKKPIEAITASLPYYGVFAIYLGMRIHAVGVSHTLPVTDPLVDPFLYATHSQKLATKWWALGRYIEMLFFPYPLSCDYSFSTIPYHNFSQPSVWFGIIVFTAIIIWTVVEFFKKSTLAFVLLFFLACIALISNFVLDLGAILGERLLFHSSLAFVIILSYYFMGVTKGISQTIKKTLTLSVLSIITIFCFAETVQRNAQWKDDNSLFIHDVNVSTGSALLNNNAGWCYIGKSESPDNKPEQAIAYLDSAKKYLYKALAIDKDYAASFINLATVYFHFSIPDSAKHYLDEVKRIYPNHPSLGKISGLVGQLYLGQAMQLGKQKKPMEAINELKKGINLLPDNADLWYNLGGAYYTINQWDSARYAWNTALKLKPDYRDAQRGLQAISQLNTAPKK